MRTNVGYVQFGDERGPGISFQDANVNDYSPSHFQLASQSLMTMMTARSGWWVVRLGARMGDRRTT